jgi:hypothetical protein
MVNIRATLDKAILSEVLDSWLVPRLIEIGKGLFYKERNWDRILQIAVGQGLSPMPINSFAAWLPVGRVDQKRSDALQMINAISAHLAAGVTPLTVSYQFQDTGYHKAAAQRFIEA